MQDPYTHRTNWFPIGVIMVVVGAMALAVAAVYFAVPAHSLPSLMGHLTNPTSVHRTKRGVFALVAGIVLAAGGAGLIVSSRRAT